jgi:ATP-dependent exoDNAse (exonuclease V) alpha subunit
MTGENATADEVSQRCRAERVRSGEVESDGVAIRSGVAGDGDEIVTLRNDRRIRTDTGEFVRNGARWTVIGRTANGELHVQGFDGASTVLPATYVREDVGLAYALTVHKAQGQTTDRAVLFVDDRTTAEQLYVGMTRGRLENRAFVVTDGTVGDEHSPQPTTTAKETLVAAMRRSANEPSAHDVMRLAFEEARQRPRRQEEIDYAEMPHVEHVIRGPHLRM